MMVFVNISRNKDDQIAPRRLSINHLFKHKHWGLHWVFFISLRRRVRRVLYEFYGEQFSLKVIMQLTRRVSNENFQCFFLLVVVFSILFVIGVHHCFCYVSSLLDQLNNCFAGQILLLLLLVINYCIIVLLSGQHASQSLTRSMLWGQWKTSSTASNLFLKCGTWPFQIPENPLKITNHRRLTLHFFQTQGQTLRKNYFLSLH